MTEEHFPSSTSEPVTAEDQEDRDQLYAAKFWENQPKGMREVMAANIETALKKGQFASFVSPNGLDEKDKAKLSAYRQLARDLGYEMGQFTAHPESHTVSAPVSKIQN